MGVEQLVGDAQVVAEVGLQYGDEGKGKLAALLAAEWADVGVRGQGGNNAGHTVILSDGSRIVLHHLPSGIVHDASGKVSVIGRGCVVNPEILLMELAGLRKRVLSYNNFAISGDAGVVMPYHLFFENASGDLKRINTTGRGIGPAYSDRVARRGITINDFLNTDILNDKVRVALDFYAPWLAGRELTADAGERLSVDNIVDKFYGFGLELSQHVRDTAEMMAGFLNKGKRILLEGAQGTLLSIEHGTYPNVTSSDASVYGLCAGADVPLAAVGLIIGVLKAPFMTRVGRGAFPTEFGGKVSEEHCDAGEGNRLRDELVKYKIPFEEEGDIAYEHRHETILRLMNSKDESERGAGIRLAGEEYGSTTKRPRRIGRFDGAAARYAANVNGRLIKRMPRMKLAVMRSDVCSSLEEVELCVGYIYNGPPRLYNGRSLEHGAAIGFFPRDDAILKDCQPVYEALDGWREDISGARRTYDLPKEAIQVMHRVALLTGLELAVISVGPKAEQTIFVGSG